MSAMTSAPAWLRGLAGRDDVGGHPWFAAHPAPVGARRRSAVLVLFGPGPDGEPDVLLTERSHTMRSHPGQVSFPGGAIDPGDDGPVGAALREAEEEVGLEPSGVDVLTVLPSLYLAPSGNAVTPVLGWWPAPVPVRVVDTREVARVVRVPLDHLLDPARRFTAAFGPYRGPGFEVADLFVWGFTATLLDAVLDLAGVSRPWDRDVVRDLPDSVRSPWMRMIDEGEGA